MDTVTTSTIVKMTTSVMAVNKVEGTKKTMIARMIADTIVTPIPITTVTQCAAGTAKIINTCRLAWPSAIDCHRALSANWSSAALCRQDLGRKLCPGDLERHLPPPPPDCEHVVIGGHVVLLNRRTFVVVDVFHLEIG